MPGEYEKQLNQLLKLCAHEGWKVYAYARAKELEAHPSGLYAGLVGELVARMQQQKEAKNERPSLARFPKMAR